MTLKQFFTKYKFALTALILAITVAVAAMGFTTSDVNSAEVACCCREDCRGGQVIERIDGHNSIGVKEPANRWYLAEGCTEGGFDTWVLVQNPNEAQANVSITYMTPAGEVTGPSVAIPGNSRKSFKVADSTGNVWEVSSKVESNIGVIAERSMYWDNREGGHDSIGVTETANAWYLAEGCTEGGFETWILVQNPNVAQANVTVTYMTPDGEVAGPAVSLAPNSRQSFNVADTVPGEWEVSSKVESSLGVVAERSMYWNRDGYHRVGGHDSVGVTAPSEVWYLAEGSTKGGYETWVLVQNPNDRSVDVSLTYMTSSGAVSGPIETIAASSRASFSAADTVPGEWEVSTHVESADPVVAERSVFWSDKEGGHNSVGVNAPGKSWYLAEGCTKGGFETWVLVQNPNKSEADVTLTYMTSSGERAGPAVKIPASSRASFNVADTVPGEWEVSTEVTSNKNVIAERSMYWSKDITPEPSPEPQPAPEPQPEPQPEPEPEIEYVVVTRTGEKYHRPTCKYVVGKTDTRTLTVEQAKAEGYTPCSVCDPPG